MRLLQLSLRSLLIYALLLVLISIPVSFFSMQAILNEEVDESLVLYRDQFIKHIKNFEYLDDLETDLKVLDQLAYDISIKPFDGNPVPEIFQTVLLYDSTEHEYRPFRQLSSEVIVKGKMYLLSVRMSLVDNDELVMVISTVQVALIFLLFIGLILINRSLSKKLWKPFYKTLDQLKAYEIDKSGGIETEKTNILEFDDLNKTVSHLTERNRKAFIQQKEFIENASHELQTPLAIFQSKLDILMQSPVITESEASVIGELESTTQRMARLNKNLLLLTKIDNEQFAFTELVEVSAIIKNIVSNLKLMADLEAITITVSVEVLTLQANKTLVEVLLTNLLHNAILHTLQKGSVSVELANRTLKIGNTGNPVKMEVDKMFQRFSKESMNAKSSGLGLAIVKQICDTSGYELAYKYAENCHSFSVTFR